VRDGDTIVLDSGEVVRYLGIDTPEHDACYGDAARAANVRLVAGVDVALTDDIRCRDVYERRLAYVSAGGEDVGALLLARGLARLDIIPPNDARADAYRELADAARAGGRGLWGACR
jgi:micrococcal nuclease